MTKLVTVAMLRKHMKILNVGKILTIANCGKLYVFVDYIFVSARIFEV
jgi:hypothetical protein